MSANTTDFGRLYRILGFGFFVLFALVFGLFYLIEKRVNSFKQDNRLQDASQQRLNLPVARLPDVAADGQLIYVPAYSHVYGANGNPILLTVTLSVRNTDSESSIVLSRVDYFDTDGNLKQSYLKNPTEIGPLATKEFLVDRSDVGGGSGANFLVEWSAAEPVTAPIMEAVMIDTTDGQGIAFVRAGLVLAAESE